MRYATVVECSQAVAATAKRTEKIARMAALLREAPPEDAPILVGLARSWAC